MAKLVQGKLVQIILKFAAKKNHILSIFLKISKFLTMF
jgi:hypothetical protein